ncbi:HD domain-containing protein [Nakaseomyces glabratus]|uniref:5'-deoxynucleotidase n=1 Tax=Candida glabrata TaxID=5478 RepID=A0A0W0CIZ9_CANGB|nr:HD domain-containing protein [Nakaseomyces glabratus]KTA99052.1 HD domain-containing protein [Nakaseomyces glabratus]KTA99552.1 HD domain-containing protein [Nakaseomyces glabratus]KTB14661.1 HD domain-containing protein [Nakaseomyces glabratus]OXB44884.1 hypothetical protein B1J91_C01749g [Nakaseomyces glabratus]
MRQMSNTRTVSQEVVNGDIKLSTKIWAPEDYIPQDVKNMLAEDTPNYMLSFMKVLEQLKVQRRTGWLDHGMTKCESIADHMYRMGIISMLIKNKEVNKDQCVKIALIHDMAESLVGDITPVDPIGKEEKHRREMETINYISETLIKPFNEEAAEEIKSLWYSYENITSLEARYVKDIDKYELLVQCFEYEKQHKGKLNFQSFFQAAEWVKTDEVKEWVNDLIARRDRFFASLEKS